MTAVTLTNPTEHQTHHHTQCGYRFVLPG